MTTDIMEITNGNDPLIDKKKKASKEMISKFCSEKKHERCVCECSLEHTNHQRK